MHVPKQIVKSRWILSLVKIWLVVQPFSRRSGQIFENPAYAEQWIGFPDAAVDRIVPLQNMKIHFCSSWAFCEWVIDDTNRKAKEIQLEGVHYVADLEPYIERKLFSVNTGHATVAYTGALLGYQTIDEAMQDALVVAQLKSVLQETGKL